MRGSPSIKLKSRYPLSEQYWGLFADNRQSPVGKVVLETLNTSAERELEVRTPTPCR